MPRFLSNAKKEALRRRDASVNAGVCTCVYCEKEVVIGAQTTNKLAASFDHKLARTQGGSLTDPKNLVVACYGCNNNKKDKPLAAWLKEMGFNAADVAKRMEARTGINHIPFLRAAKADGFRD